MKKQLLYISAILSMAALFSFAPKKYNPLSESVIIAPNTYMDTKEVSNLDWREFMSWTANKYGNTSSEYFATLPDSTVWIGTKFNSVREFYLRHELYNNYPVVGISHEQAKKYCTWRAARVNEFLKINNKKSELKISCRLPSKNEWEKLAKSEMGSYSTFTADNYSLQKVTDDGVVHEGDITSPTKSLMPTLNGYYHLIGNVAEMVAEEGIAKGGSWCHIDTEVTIDRDFNYTAPTNWLGFRCVLETK